MGNRLGNECPPAPGSSETLILVVGNDSAFKARVAQDLAEAANATPQPRTSKAGVRFFNRNDKPIVIDTAPFVKDLSREVTARLWVTQNSLRQLSGQVVLVICAIASTYPEDEIYQGPKSDQNEFSWLSVLACVFENNRNQVMILVNSDGSSTDEAAKERLRPVLRRDGFECSENIIFYSPSTGGGYLNTIIQNVLQSRLETATSGNDERTAKNEKTGISNRSKLPTFKLPMVATNGRRMYGPWGPENIILFGLSGSGKSTLAKMLTTGRLDGLDSLSRKFSSSSGARGETKKVNEGQGRGWRVFDTPGLGESNKDTKSGVSTDLAAKRIREHVVIVEGDYCHYIFVTMQGRARGDDRPLWNVFTKLFNTDGMYDHITVVVSGADQEWLDANISDLKKAYPGSIHFIPAEFPPKDSDKEVDEESEGVRLKSLKALEESLASCCRLDLPCRMGTWSMGSQMSWLSRSADLLSNPTARFRQSHALGPAGGQASISDGTSVRTLLKLKHQMSRTFRPNEILSIVPNL